MLEGLLPFDIAWLRRRAAQVMRYAAVSIIANLTTITVLGILVDVVAFPAGWSNVIAVSVATIPSFELNRRWVWSKSGTRSWVREVVPFWTWAFVELGLSTLAVHVVADHATAVGWSRATRTFAAEVTSIGTTGVLWVLQFLLFDRVLFRGGAGSGPEAGVGAQAGAGRPEAGARDAA